MENFESFNSPTSPLKEKQSVDKIDNTINDLLIDDHKQNINKQEDNKETKVKTTSQDRCNLCKRRLTITEKLVTCKCGNIYCTNHRHATNHTCTFDYKKDKNDKEIVNARFEKLNKI
jgi:hypothetical protein